MTHPISVDFSVVIGPIEIKERVLAFTFEQAPFVKIYEMTLLAPAFNVSVYDVATGMTVINTGSRPLQCEICIVLLLLFQLTLGLQGAVKMPPDTF